MLEKGAKVFEENMLLPVFCCRAYDKKFGESFCLVIRQRVSLLKKQAIVYNPKMYMKAFPGTMKIRSQSLCRNGRAKIATIIYLGIDKWQESR